MKKFIVILFFFLSAIAGLDVMAQGQPAGQPGTEQPQQQFGEPASPQTPQQRQIYGENQLYQENRFNERKVIEWPHLREADVMWRRKITRRIDVREKMNLCLSWPKNPINSIIVRNVNAGILTVYTDDSLNKTYTPEEARKRGGYEGVVTKFYNPEDPDAGSYDTVEYNALNPDWIYGYDLVEEWVFDKKHAIMRTRILDVVPLVYKRDQSGNVTGTTTLLYHIKYDDFRKIMVNEQIYNRQNDAMRLTYDDFFEQRLFSSYITKQSNEYDIDIKGFDEFKEDNLAALLEADRIRQELFIFEHDLWEY
jgi:gliding motility associated protien GldN